MDIFVISYGIIYYFKFRALNIEENQKRRIKEIKLRG
jgi:hypothetical protein